MAMSRKHYNLVADWLNEQGDVISKGDLVTFLSGFFAQDNQAFNAGTFAAAAWRNKIKKQRDEGSGYWRANIDTPQAKAGELHWFAAPPENRSSWDRETVIK